MLRVQVGLDCQHLSVALMAEGLRVNEHVRRHSKTGYKYVTVLVDLAPVRCQIASVGGAVPTTYEAVRLIVHEVCQIRPVGTSSSASHTKY